MVTRRSIFFKPRHRGLCGFKNMMRLVTIFYWREFSYQQDAISQVNKEHTVFISNKSQIDRNSYFQQTSQFDETQKLTKHKN